MGLFDFFKKKPAAAAPATTPQPAADIDLNLLFLVTLEQLLLHAGLRATLSPQHAAVIVNDELEIASAILPGDYHPMVLPVLVIAIHKEHFPEGIETSLAGLGDTAEKKTVSAAENYLGSIFPALLESLTDSHHADLDFYSTIGGRPILWHPKPGELVFQGQWNAAPEHSLYDLLAERVPPQLPDRKLNWLKLYMGRQPDGSLTGECLLNNEHWDEGYQILDSYARSWGQHGVFLAQKQFIMFRRCDASDQ